ncbi:MAG: PKD domain-containing protein, partial [Candidatus Thermoplasmatota archaeon]
VRGVKTECLGITFDNKNASAWSEITRKHEFDTAYIHPDPTIGNPVEQILDSNMSGMDLIDVYWQKLIARIHPKGDVWHPIGEPIMFDACYCVKRYNWGDPKTFITAQDIEQRGISYHWDFGDGTTEVTYTPYVNHTFTTKGNFTVVLTIRDLEGNEDCDFTVIHTYTVIPFPEEIVVGILGALAQAWWLWLFLIFAIPIGLAGTYYYKKKREGEI